MYVVVDVETTGGYREGNKIIEVAIVKTDGEKIIDTFDTLINPERNIPFTITRLTGISNAMVEDSPKFYEVAKKIVEFTEGCIFVAHNVFFDYNFFQREFSELGYTYKREKLCTVRLSRKAFPGLKSYSLKKLCNDIGVKLDQHHRAMADALATTDILHLIKGKDTELLSELVKKQGKKMALPGGMDREIIDNLPESPGVYYFYNQGDALLYIGKSKNIKKRVTSHFRVDVKNKRDLQLKSQVSRIEYKLLGNELCALLFECHEIKEKRPHYNRKLRRKRYAAGLTLIQNSKGEKEIKASYKGEFEEHSYLFGNSKRAKAVLNNFYKAILGVEKDSLEFEKKKELIIKTLGIERYNTLVEKTFYSRLTKDTDYSLNLKGRTKTEAAEVIVKNRYPSKIIFSDSDGITEKITLIKDEELKQIVFHYNNK